MIGNLKGILDIITSGIRDFLGTNWQSVRFAEKDFAISAVIVLITAVLLKIFWPKVFPRRQKKDDGFVHSGYGITEEDMPSASDRILTATTFILMILGFSSILVAIADPYVLQSNQATHQESRQVIYIRDVSTSLGYYFSGTKTLRTEIVRDFVLNLINKRINKNDQAGYIVFASDPFIASWLTFDMKSLMFSVQNGHQIITGPGILKDPYFKKLFFAKDFTPIPYRGGTDLQLALIRAIRLFDEQDEKSGENNNNTERSVIIITDGAAENDPEVQFRELKKKKIIPYLVLIDSHKESERIIHGSDSPQVRLPKELIRQVRKYGGKAFRIDNPASAEGVSRELDKIHAIRQKIEYYTTEQHIYGRFLILAIACFVLAGLSRFIFWTSHRSV